MKRLLNWTVACVEGLRQNTASGPGAYLLSLDRAVKNGMDRPPDQAGQPGPRADRSGIVSK